MVPLPQNQNNTLALPSPRSASKRSAEQANVKTDSPFQTPRVIPRLTLAQVNVLGSPEVDRQVQGMQEQLVHLMVDVQETKAHFRAEAAAQCEGRAQDRQIYQEAYMVAERFFMSRRHVSLHKSVKVSFRERCKNS